MGLGQILVAGIGNQSHPFTRHSIGHVLVDSLADRLGLVLANKRTGYLGAKYVVIGENSVRVTLYKTKALMNLSGPPISGMLRDTGVLPSSLVIIHDSLSHKPLVVSPKFGGSANGHNGIRSIIAALGNQSDFHRLRIGIGKNNDQDAADYVMNNLSSIERDFWGRGGKGVTLVWEHIERIIQAAGPSR